MCCWWTYGYVVELSETSSSPTDSTERVALVKDEAVFILVLELDLHKAIVSLDSEERQPYLPASASQP